MTGDCQVRFCERLALKCACLLDSINLLALGLKILHLPTNLPLKNEVARKQSLTACVYFMVFDHIELSNTEGSRARLFIGLRFVIM